MRRAGVAVVAALALSVAGVSSVAFTTPASAAPIAAKAAKPAAALGDHPQDEAVALAQAKSSGKQVEVTSERTAVKTIWADPSGQLTADVSQFPTRVKQDGSWVPIDETLAAKGSRLVPAASPADVSLSATGAGQLATLATADSTSLSLGFGSTVGAPVVSSVAAVYPVTGASGENLQVASTQTGFTARVLLASAPATAPSYTFPLTLNGLSAALSGGAVTFSDSSGTVVAQSARLSMWDASKDVAGDHANQVAVDAKLVTTASGGTNLVLTPSPTWLAAAKYPVTIDPDVAAVTGVGDTYVSSGSTNGDTNYWQDYRLRVGSDDGSTKYRAIDTFEVGDYEGRDITGATLKMYQYYGATCTAQTTLVYPTNFPVPTKSVTWNTQSGTNAQVAQEADTDAQWSSSSSYDNGNSSIGCADAWVSMDVTKMVNGWDSGELLNPAVYGSSPNDSFELQASNETSSSGDKRFCSGDPNPTDPGSSPCTTSTLEPVLSLSYWPLRGVQSWYSLTSHPLNDHSTLSVNNDDGDTVIQAKDVDLNGDGEDLGIDRFYNTLSPETSTSLGTGGWSLSVGPDVYLAADSTGYRYDYHAPGGTRFGDFVRKSTNSGDASYKSFYAPTLGGLNADLSDGGNDSNGIDTFTMTFHSSQTKYVFKKVDTSSSNLYLAQIKDRSGNTITFNYVSGTHQLATISDTEGRSIIVTYTGGVITKISSTTKAADGTTDVTRTWQYGYTGTQLTSYTDPAGKVTTYGWVSGVIQTITDPVNSSGLAPTATLAYWTGNTLKQVTYSRATANGGNVVFGFVYYTSGSTGTVCPGTPDRWTTVTDLTPGDAAVNKGPTYCFSDRKGTVNAGVHVEDALGHDKAVSYTADNQSDTSTSASNSGGGTDGSTVYAYSTAVTDDVSSMTEPKDTSGDTPGTTSFDYTNTTSQGGKWLPTATRDPAGNCGVSKYDSQGRTSDAYIGFVSTKSTVDGCEGASQTTGTGVAHYHRDYNTDGSVKDSYDGNGSSTSTDQQTNYTYWALGDTGYVADTSGQLKSVVKPGGSCDQSELTLCTTYTYDGAGRVSSVTNAPLATTTFVYDALDRVTAVELNGYTNCLPATISSGRCVQYTYDAEGNLTSRVDQAGTTTFTYDQMNRQLSQTYPGTTSDVWVRDGAGNMTSYSQSVGGATDQVTYTYDIANRPATVVDHSGTGGAQQTFALTEDADGRPATLTYPSTTGVSGNFTYKKSGKAATIDYKKSGASDLLDYTYNYNVASIETDQLRKDTISGSISALTGGVLTYGYTASNELASLNNTTGTTYGYQYDGGGNVTKATSSAASNPTYSGYDRAEQLCWTGTNSTAPASSTQLGTTCPSTPNGYTSHSFDNAGNDLGTTSNPNTYNTDDQATKVAGITQSYLDLGNNLRVGAGSDTTLNGPLGVTSRTTSAGTTFYTRDPSGVLLDEHGAEATNYYLADYQGSVAALIGPSGTVDGTYVYDPYGKATVNTQSGGTAATTNPWRYTGAYYDTEGDGFYHLAARYYDPTTGRFTQPDPSGHEANPYLYSNGDPIDGQDPTGLNTLDKVLGYTATGFGVAATIADFAGAPEVGLAFGAVGLGIDVAKTGVDAGGLGDDSVGGDLGTDAVGAATFGTGAEAGHLGLDVLAKGYDFASNANDVGSDLGLYG